MPYLLFSRGSSPIFRVQLKNQSTKIGRSPHCDLVLDDPNISREHASIYLIEGQYFLKKTGQAPLLLQGKEIESHPLKGGDLFSVGPWEAKFVSENGGSEENAETVSTHASSGKTEAVVLHSRGVLSEKLQLQILQPDKAVEFFPFRSEAVTIGAASNNDLQLDDPYCSSRHCKITRQGGRVKVFDLNSTNGSYVNGVRVVEAELEPGHTLKLGQSQLILNVEHCEEAVEPIKTERFHGLLGASPAMQKLYGLLQKVGPTEATVLVLGESGTGKELVARAIHRLSSRAKNPFVAINCGAISKELIESELFGHEKGAFTGALRQHEGAFGQAAGGTLFLDEIGELPLELQPKLLRVLENGSYRRVGGVEELKADVRVVAATHRDLASAVYEGKFRQDLFFRLFVLPLVLDPLRQHREDLGLLCQEFLREFAVQGSPKRLSGGALEKLQLHPFHGNVRELKNLLLRAHILSAGIQIEESDLLFSEDILTKKNESSIDSVSLEKLEAMEKKLVLKTLMAHRWNKTRAAEALGVAKSTLFAKIRLYDLQEPPENEPT